MKFTDKLQYLRYLVDKRGMQPVYLILGLTYDCNSFCRTCFNWEQLRKNKEHELSLDELQKTFSSMGDLLFIVMSGGEPFLRRDLPDICELLATNNHVKQITIPTGAITSDLIARSGRGDAAALPRHADRRQPLDRSRRREARLDPRRAGQLREGEEDVRAADAAAEKYANLTVNVHTCLCTYNADDLDVLFDGVPPRFSGDLVPLVRDAARRSAGQEHPADHDGALSRAAAEARGVLEHVLATTTAS